MPIAKDIIDRTLATKHGEAAYLVTEKMIDAGFECFWIGGAVRDMLLGKVPKEVDMTTSALPEQTEKLFKKSDASAAALGTIIVSEKGCTFEITTYREDDAVSDGRHPESVRFGGREKDVLRRDATVNAMYWNPVTREFFDPCKGEKDLKERLVRFIGDAAVRIKQDALRILRIIRLRAVINGQYEPQTYKALQSNAPLTKILSGTRVLEELEKLLKTPRAETGIEDLFETGVLKEVLPELHACRGVPQPKEYHQEGDVLEHLKKCVASFTDDHAADVRLSALLHDIGKSRTFSITDRIHFDHHAEESAEMAEAMLKRLHMPSARIQKIQWLIVHHMMMGSFKGFTDERKAHWYFHPWFRELLQLFWLDIAGSEPSDFSLYDSIIQDYDQFLNAHPRPQKPLLSGDEVMKILGIGPGEQVGRVLQELHDAQVRKDVTTKAEAREFLNLRKR